MYIMKEESFPKYVDFFLYWFANSEWTWSRFKKK